VLYLNILRGCVKEGNFNTKRTRIGARETASCIERDTTLFGQQEQGNILKCTSGAWEQPRLHGKCKQPSYAGFFGQKFGISILFSTSLLAAYIENGRGSGHGFDMAGEKFDMPSGPGTLFARTLLLVNLQPAQTGSAMSSCCQKRRAEARRWHSAPEFKKRTFKNSMWFAKFDMSCQKKDPARMRCFFVMPSS
jgi:hypothetical protein